MHSEIVIDAPAQRIFECASATERWPELLPHYRYVRVLAMDGERRVVEMAARRALEGSRVAIPVRWRAEQLNDAAVPEIFFRHITGWARGMRVWWRFSPAEGGRTRVRIEHELDSPLAPFIGRYFIDPIAGRTLRRFKEILEA